MLIKTIKIWQFLQHLDGLVEEEDERTTSIVNDFFKPYGLSIDDLKNYGMLPFAQLKTTLSILLSTLCFARWKVEDSHWENSMRSLSYYDLECQGPDRPKISQVIRTIRNAAAHGFDDSDFLTFPEGKVVSFQTTQRGISKVTFCTERGFVDFVSDYIRVIQRTAVEHMKSSKT